MIESNKTYSTKNGVTTPYVPAPATPINVVRVSVGSTEWIDALREKLIREAVEQTSLVREAESNGRHIEAHDASIRREVWLEASDIVLELRSASIENKISDSGRGRASLAGEGWRSWKGKSRGGPLFAGSHG